MMNCKSLLQKIFVPLLFSLTLTAAEPDFISLDKIDHDLLELKTKITTLEEYSPQKFPDFEKLDRINQLVEQLDFDSRKFELYIQQYNLIEDKILPFLLKLSRDLPRSAAEILSRTKEYSSGKDKNILLIQKNINFLKLKIERIEKEIERVQTAAKNRQPINESGSEEKDLLRSVSTSDRIALAKESSENLMLKLKTEKEYYEKLKKRQAEKEQKIIEKKQEIEDNIVESKKTKNPVAKHISQISAQVMTIRVNGLEIPQLNTIKTFCFLSASRINTLQGRIDSLNNGLKLLKLRSNKELQKKIIKGIIIVFIAIFIVMILIRVSRRIGKKVLKTVEQNEKIDSHRVQRYITLNLVIQSIVKIFLMSMAVLWIFGELNIDYAPFLVAAGGISLAIGFGAQSLVKDIVSGFFMLMEEQFALGDYVEINNKSGTIENISLRTIKFRSLDGTLHIVPNGSINKVSNHSHQWSRAIVSIGVSYDEKSDKVLRVLDDICKSIYDDPNWQNLIIEKPMAQGIISFGDSTVNFRILAKTRPGDQWAIGREINIRIKQEFDREGIEIPYPFMNILDRSNKKE